MSPSYRYLTRERRTKESRRFVSGQALYVQDVSLPDTKHVALVQSPYPRAQIRAIDASRALVMPGVYAVLTGEELAGQVNPIRSGLDLPNVRWYPLAVGMTRYAGEWVAAVVADSRYLAEDAAELVDVDYEPLPAVVDPESAASDHVHLVHPDHGSNVLYEGKFVWGPVERDFAAAAHRLSFRARWGRSSTVPIETFGVLSRWSPGTEILEIWASIQMPNYAELVAEALGMPLNAILVHHDVDVGGSYGVKRGIKHTVLAGYLARKLGMPVRLIEDRLENLSSGDNHGPDRIFDVDVAFEGDGRIRSLRIRALDDAGAYPGRGPFQLAKPVTAIVGPYRINSVQYEPISVTTNKSGQVPVRGFGQSPANFAIETALDKVSRYLALDRVEVRQRNFIRSEDFPYQIPSGSKYDSGDYHEVLEKVVRLADLAKLISDRDRMRGEGKLAGIGVATCLEPSGGNNIFEHLMSPKAPVTTYAEGCQIRVDPHGQLTAIMGTTTSGQGHETLVATIVGEELGQDPDLVRVLHADSLAGIPTRSPVASRMAVMLGGAASGAAKRLKQKLVAIGAHQLGRPITDVEYSNGVVVERDNPSSRLGWSQLCRIAHREIHRLPPGMEPGLEAQYVYQVPGGGELPDEQMRVQIYPCYAFQAHIAFVEIDSCTGKVYVPHYYVAHDCGTVINPSVVRGMIIGGIAHGIGAAFYEEFAYDDEGQFLSGSFADYVLPSVYEIPSVKDIAHCTPSPLTSHGQKGSGEGGYLGAPAALASAVNDALEPLGLTIDCIPMRMAVLEALFQNRVMKS